MPRSDAIPSTQSPSAPLVYSPTARALHWTVAALVIITAPIGFIMVDREDHKFADGVSEAEKAAFGATTDQMFSAHKLIGVIILTLMIARWIYRLTHGAPRSVPTIAGWQKGLSHAVHWSLYLLLLMVPIGGYLGIAYGGYLDVFGIHLPGFGIAKDDKFSELLFKWHGWGATVILGLVALHLAGAMYHTFVADDGVLQRMWPRSKG